MDVNKKQNLPTLTFGTCTPLIYFCRTGNLLVIKVLFLIGADCTRLCERQFWFPMLAAAHYGHLDICKWLFKYGGDAKYQINKETSDGCTPLSESYTAWHHGLDKVGKTCRWLLLNGGGQHLSNKAMRRFAIYGEEEWNSNLLVLWMRKNMQLHDTFMLLLCGARNQTIHRQRSLQILDGHPGIMEWIGDYAGLLRGKEFRMLEEFNELVIEYNNTDESSSDGSDGNAEDGEGGGGIVNGDDTDTNLNLTNRTMIPIVVAMVAVVVAMVVRSW